MKGYAGVMTDSWTHFVANALRPPQDDPYVALLREKLHTGCRVVRVHVVVEPARSEQPEYLVVLDCQQQLSEMRIPHSPAFTRWSLGDGIALASPEEESVRFSLLLTERWEPVILDHGKDLFQSTLVARAKKLGPPQAVAALGTYSLPVYEQSLAKVQVERSIDQALAASLWELAWDLHYEPGTAAAILDEALTRYLDDLLQLRSILFGP